MPPLNVAGTVPVLIVGQGEQVEGEIWLANPTGAAITISSATLTITLATGVDVTPVNLPEDAAIPAQESRRLLIATGMEPFTAPGTFSGSLDLVTSAGPQSIAARLVVTATVAPLFVPNHLVFQGVAAGGVVNASVVVRNPGNADVVVGPIADEPLFEARAHSRVLVVDVGGTLAVEPAVGLSPVGTVTFTNAAVTIGPLEWAEVPFQINLPAALPANRHLRALPRISTERFAVDLLTVP